MQTAPPRHFTTGARPPGNGMPADRAARVAARRVFVELKTTFLQAVDDIHGAQFEWLRAQVRSAEEPVDLWLLRAPLFAALAGTDADCRRRRQLLRRALDSVFHDSEPASAFALF